MVMQLLNGCNFQKRLFSKKRLHAIYSCFDENTKYQPKVVDGCCDRLWNNCISNKQNLGDNFTILMPPPNVTGNLHIGHALSFTLQDAIIRWKRMQGYNTVWYPGYDHAGIATQVQVEKHLQKTRGKVWVHDESNKDEFVSICEKWAKDRQENIRKQIKSLGLLPNWELEYFTLDKAHSNFVQQTFIQLFKSGKIYRDNRIVNWSCKLQSAISDMEVEMQQINGETKIQVPGYNKTITFGILYRVAYQLVGSIGNSKADELVVATTRPETIIGDVALAVNPSDNRYKKFIGRKVRNPITNEEMPIIGDDLIDAQFGTGICKITPAHSLTDFNIARRHNLKSITVFNETGRIINKHVPNLPNSLIDIPRFTARYIILDMLANSDHYRGCDINHRMSIPICSRSGDVVEYRICPQWFFNVSDACDKAISAIQQKHLTIQPSGYIGTFLQFLQSKEPWCISRQLKWGHRIPMWHHPSRSEEWFIGDYSNEKEMTAAGLKPDQDVLDTWFSSALLPLSISGYGNNNDNSHSSMSMLFPQSLLVTGHDIVPLWVCRMMVMSLELIDKLPFRHVLLHGMICDSLGRKMSKTRGNVIDPIDLVGRHMFDRQTLESGSLAVEQFLQDKGEDKGNKSLVEGMGADALRFALLEHSLSGQQINFSVDRVVLARNFLQKMWQSLRFVRQFWEPLDTFDLEKNLEENWKRILSLLDGETNKNEVDNGSRLMHQWLLYNLSETVIISNKSLDGYVMHNWCLIVRHFWWSYFCNVFIEWCKTEQDPSESMKNQRIALLAIDTCLHLLHPVIPQITEVLWHSIYRDDTCSTSLCMEKFPSDNIVKNAFTNPSFKKSSDLVDQIISSVNDINFWLKATNVTRKDIRQSSSKCWIVSSSEVSNKKISAGMISRLSGIPINRSYSTLDGFRQIPLMDGCHLLLADDLCDWSAVVMDFKMKLDYWLKQKEKCKQVGVFGSAHADSDVKQQSKGASQLSTAEQNIREYLAKIRAIQKDVC